MKTRRLLQAFLSAAMISAFVITGIAAHANMRVAVDEAGKPILICTAFGYKTIIDGAPSPTNQDKPPQTCPYAISTAHNLAPHMPQVVPTPKLHHVKPQKITNSSLPYITAKGRTNVPRAPPYA